MAVQRWSVAAAPVVQAPFLHASEVTAVDASPEMLAIAAAHVVPERVRFVQADLFTWTPTAATSSATIHRQLPDGTAYRLVKVPHRPADLERQLRHLGWRITVTSTAGPFYWGTGRRATHPS